MIKKLVIENYKSLQEISLVLRPLTVFVGANNSGKSNIIDAFQFISEFAQHGVSAVEKRGGSQLLVWGGELLRKICFTLEGEIFRQEGSSRVYEYKLEVAPKPVLYTISRETFNLETARGTRTLLDFPALEGMAQVSDESGIKLRPIGTSAQQPCLFLCQDSVNYPFLGDFYREVQNWTFYNLVPSRMQMPVTARRESRLQSEGENISTVLLTLRSEDISAFAEVEGILKEAIPEIRQLVTPLTEDGRTYISAQESAISLQLPAWAMSDGTLRLLAFLAVVHNPSPPALICFEEPENQIHPGLLELVASQLKLASQRTQVMITTHSPYLLDFLAPQDLVIVEKKEGKTQLKRVEDEKGVKEALQTLGLGEMWYSGHLGGIP